MAFSRNLHNYFLPNGSNTPRQLTNIDDEVTLTCSYTPWRDTLETHGTGSFTQGYFVGITLAPPATLAPHCVWCSAGGAGVDAATGLIYVGNGQYYDPATGRFLTRDTRPNQNNPYTPIDPTGALLGPLALLALAYGRKKSRGKWDTLVILLVLGLSLGMGLAACVKPTPGPSPAPELPPPTVIIITPRGDGTATLTAKFPAPQGSASDKPIECKAEKSPAETFQRETFLVWIKWVRNLASSAS